MSLSIPSVAQLHRAIKIAEQIQALESELSAILGAASAPVSKSASAPANKGKRKYTRKSAAAAPAESVTATESAAPAKKTRKKGKMSPEGRAAIVAAQKARWAKVKKEKAKK